ncbi:hypothetical protein [Microbacterium panaciterrae]|uniref:hypothetical protein n=1 Tax=Microbacterium panaciterrae TaxID=985759 RepID=UPI0031EB24D5
MTLLLVVALFVAVGSGGFLVFEQTQVAIAQSEHAVAFKKKEALDKAVADKKAKDDAAAAEAAAAAQAVAAAAAETARLKAEADAAAVAAGFFPSPTADGEVFIKPMDGGCTTMLLCSWISVAVVSPCVTGVYIAANLETSDGVVVGRTNSITGALDPQHPAVVELKYAGDATPDLTSRVTDAHCL